MDFLLALHDHLDAGEDQERAEDVDDPGELGDERRAQGDHDGPHDERAEDAPEQHLVLIHRRHREVGEQQREDKDVVHAQRLLDEVAGEELQRLLRAVEVPDAAVEQQRQRHPHDRPGDRLLEGDDVRLAVKDAEVQRQHRQHEHVETDPEPNLINHNLVTAEILTQACVVTNWNFGNNC